MQPSPSQKPSSSTKGGELHVVQMEVTLHLLTPGGGLWHIAGLSTAEHADVGPAMDAVELIPCGRSQLHSDNSSWAGT